MIRSIRYITLLVLLQFVTGISVLYAQSITSASGIVRDSVSGEPLSYVSVMFENSTIGAMTDDDGAFSLQNDKGLTRLVVSSLGYDNKVVNLKAGQKNDNLDILLSPTSFQIAEVEVRPTKERYSRKDNPAVELIKKVIEHKNDNRIEAKDEYQSEVYEKLSMSLDDFNPNLEKNKFLKKFKFIKNYLDTSEFNGKPILTISVRETISDQYYRKHPKAEKTITKAKRQQGIDKTLDDGGAITANLEEIFKGVNIFDNNINILLNRFVSPLSSTLAVSYYKYYIMDTVDVAGDKCVDLAFVPVNSQSYGFTGRLYITLDGCCMPSRRSSCTYFSSSSVRTITVPPSRQVMVFTGSWLNTQMSEKLPTILPLYLEPNECAASWMTRRLCCWAKAAMASWSHKMQS